MAVRSVRAARTVCAFVLVALPAPASAATTYVVHNTAPGSANVPNCGLSGEPPCATIQYAVDKAASGDTISVGPGNYPEQVDVTKALTIRGSGRSATNIISPARATLVSHGLPGEYPIITGRTAGPLTIADLTINGNQQGFSAPNCLPKNLDGIHFFRISGTIENVRITEVRTPTNPEDDCGGAILAYTDQAAALNWSVLGTRVDNSGPVGSIFQRDNASSANTVTLQDNVFEGPATISAEAPPGAVTMSNATATIDGNSFSGFACEFSASGCGLDPLTDVGGFGISLAAARAGTTISDNTFTGTDQGVIAGVSGAAEIAISGNTFNGSRSYGLGVAQANVKATSNRFEGGATGLYALGSSATTPTTIALQGNSFTGLDRGIQVTRQAATHLAPIGSGAGNRFVGNDVGAVIDTPDPFSLENSWWGCNAGPGQPGCDTVTGPVDAEPRLVLGLAADPAAIPKGGATSALAASVATNSNGEAAGGVFPDGTPIAFATDLGSIGPQPTTSAGSATSTLTSGSVDGVANVTATLDNQSVTTPVTIGTPGQPPPPAAQACDNAIKGEKKGDKLVGTAEGDVIKGKAGNDKITGGAGEDCLKGGPGNDKIKARDGEVDRVNCGSGKDRVKADKADRIKRNCETVKAR